LEGLVVAKATGPRFGFFWLRGHDQMNWLEVGALFL